MRRKGNSVQELIGIKSFGKYGLITDKGELLFYSVTPTNISVLSNTSIEIKIRHLLMVLCSVPDIEIVCTDSSECFDENKSYLYKKANQENNSKVRELIEKDISFLDHIQTEMATARQFLFVIRCNNKKEEQIFNTTNRIEKILASQNFEVRRMDKKEIKRVLAIYFDASLNGELMADNDGEQFLQENQNEKVI